MGASSANSSRRRVRITFSAIFDSVERILMGCFSSSPATMSASFQLLGKCPRGQRSIPYRDEDLQSALRHYKTKQPAVTRYSKDSTSKTGSSKKRMFRLNTKIIFSIVRKLCQRYVLIYILNRISATMIICFRCKFKVLHHNLSPY